MSIDAITYRAAQQMGHISTFGVLILALFLSKTRGTHFRGGTISWKYLGRSGNAYDVEISYKFGWRLDWETPSCNDTVIQNQMTGYKQGEWKQYTGLLTYTAFNETSIICTAYDINENWAYGYNSFVETVTTTGPFDIGYTGGNWITSAALVSGGGWALKAGNIDFDIRSDTGQVNNPPTALSSPIVKLSQGCPETILITHLDRDNDRVKCRYAVSGAVPDECGTACNGPSSTGYAHFKLDEAACSMRYDGGGATGLIAVTLVLADYPNANVLLGGSRTVSTSEFFSEIPLQFLMQVDATTSCNQVPTYPTQTIQNDVQIDIPFNGNLNKTLYARSSSSSTRIVQFVVLGPLGMTVGQVRSLGRNLYSAGLEWVPTEKQGGEHNVCYYASDSARTVGKKVCFTAKVSNVDPCSVNNGGCSDVCSYSGNTTTCSCPQPCWSLGLDGATCAPLMNLTCDGDSMSLSVADCASSRTVVVGDHLRQINQDRCQSSHVGNSHVLEWEASTCGFEYKANPVEARYAGKLWIWHAVDTGSAIITRGKYRVVPVNCRLPLQAAVSGDFVPELPFNNESFPINVNVQGFGAFAFYFEFYRSSAFSSVVPPAEYPMSVTVNNRFYFALGAIGQPGFTFFTHDCVATTSAADPTQPDLSYRFIRDGCLVDPTLIRITSGNPMEERFSMEAFDFNDKITSLRENADISIQCRVMLCDSGNLTTRCFQGCNQPVRKRRSVLEQYYIDRDDDDNDETSLGKVSGFPESVLQTVKGRFIMILNSKSFYESHTTSFNNIYWALMAVGLALVVIASFVSYRVIQSRRTHPAVKSGDGCAYEDSYYPHNRQASPENT